METEQSGPAAYLEALRRLGDSALANIQDRMGLLAVELHEEKCSLIRTFIWISVIVFTGMMVVVFASLMLVYLFWESARLAVLGCLTLFYGAALVLMILAFLRHLRRQSKPFAATLEELEEDRACIRNGK